MLILNIPPYPNGRGKRLKHVPGVGSNPTGGTVLYWYCR